MASLDALCDWAWRAAMGPLVEQYLPRLARSASGRPPRVVLVPMGELARVPWQAARQGGRHVRHRLVAVSQAASARMLCHTAGLTPVPAGPGRVWSSATRTPDRGRRSARRPPRGVRDPAVVLPRRPLRRAASGRHRPAHPEPGRGDEVRDWLTDRRSRPRARCCTSPATASSGPDPAAATVLPAAGRRGPADRRGADRADGRAPERAIALVVLAACRTGLSVSGYDEAYSLGTAFLAAGVRSVLSTQWSIPGPGHVGAHVHVPPLPNGRRPAGLGRAATGAAVDARRAAAGTGSDAEATAAAADGADLAAVVGWAGFVHWGQ